MEYKLIHRSNEARDSNSYDFSWYAAYKLVDKSSSISYQSSVRVFYKLRRLRKFPIDLIFSFRRFQFF